MIKHIELNNSLEKYIIDHSNGLDPVLREIIDYNKTLGDKKKYRYQFHKLNFYKH